MSDHTKEEADALFRQLRECLAAQDDDHDGDDLSPEVESWGSKHYYVVFRLKGRSVALELDDARYFAQSQWAGADEAAARMIEP